ncbi:MAG: MEDS domain-containing protein [Ignavibacteriales bacterium]
MSSDNRVSGIIGKVPWGTHFCQFYQTKEDLTEILVPYFKAGLENNEFCMWVTSEPLGVEETKEALRRSVPDFDVYLEKCQIEIIPYTHWYIKDGVFDSDRVLKGWVKKINQALANGYDGLRLTGNTFWLEKKDWNDFIDYEEKIDRVLGNYNIISLCSYSLDRCNSTEIIDVVTNHQFAVIKREGKWEQIESSKRKQAEKALKESEERFKILSEANALLLSSKDPEAIIQTIAEKVMRHLNCDVFFNYVFDESQGRLHLNAYSGTGAEVAKEIEWLDEGAAICGCVARDGYRIVSEDVQHNGDERADLVKSIGIQAYSCQPLHIEEKTIGTLSFGTKSRKSFTEDELILMSTVADQISVAIKRKKAEEALKKAHKSLEIKVKERTEELVKANISLNESEERLADAQKIAHVGSYDWNIATNEEYWSDELYLIFGLDPQIELDHNTFLNCVHPEDLEFVIHANNEALNGKPYNFDYRIILPDGKERVIYSQGGVIFDDKNTPIQMRGIVQDITERKKAEESLARIEIVRKKEIHHRIKNNLQVISSLLDLQAEKFKNRECITDSEVLEAFRESQNRVVSMALIHEELHEGEGDDTFNFSPYLEKLIENLFQTYLLKIPISI